MKKYVKEKIKVLKEFGVKLTKEQIEHMYSLSSEIAVDNFARDLLRPL